MKRNILYIVLFGASVAGIISCSKTDPGISLISNHGLQLSHNPNSNCMNCHARGSTAKSFFTAAGTIYDSFQNNAYPNTYIRFYTQPNGGGELKYTIKGDLKGNFYTTEDMDFSGGLYPSVQGINAPKHMSTPVYMGQCNSCHDKKITSRIWIR
jgi:hypothetical protein